MTQNARVTLSFLDGCVLGQWEYDRLADKSEWKGYRYSVAEWTWDAATYDDSDEPDSWGDDTKRGPFRTLDEVLKAIAATSLKWRGGKWLDKEGGSFQSVVKRAKRVVTQGIARIERVDGKPLSDVELRFVGGTFKLK